MINHDTNATCGDIEIDTIFWTPMLPTWYRLTRGPGAPRAAPLRRAGTACGRRRCLAGEGARCQRGTTWGSNVWVMVNCFLYEIWIYLDGESIWFWMILNMLKLTAWHSSHWICFRTQKRGFFSTETKSKNGLKCCFCQNLNPYQIFLEIPSRKENNQSTPTFHEITEWFPTSTRLKKTFRDFHTRPRSSGHKTTNFIPAMVVLSIPLENFSFKKLCVFLNPTYIARKIYSNCVL